MADYFKALGDRDSWWFMFFYSVTFGGFIGLASALPGYFNDQYGLSPVTAGYYTAACVFGGSLMRPLGGALADRFGGIRTLLAMYTVAAICIAAVGFNLPSPTPHWRCSSAPCSASAPAMARCSSWCRNAFVGDRRDDRPDRHGRRHRRLCPGGRHGRDQAAPAAINWRCGCSPASACWRGSACTGSSGAGEPPGVRRP
jgi:hypothetical protein